MGLAEYRRKRDFRRTTEPRGRRTKAHKLLSFVVQKHEASHLHYDFRLELDGVLKSWAVPKGPSLDPAQKRLAMQVEDHPLEYGDFEGIIPQGEYGGGTVMLWDRGTWQPVEDAKTGYQQGKLKFILQGEKLRGGWMLVRRGGRHAEAGERHWFLFKERDEFADPSLDVAKKMPLSVTTGRDLDEIAAQATRVWGPDRETKQARPKKNNAKSGRANGAALRKKLDAQMREMGARRAALPAKCPVELATLAKEAPTGDDWLHEIKFDGYRMLCRVQNGKARFISRNGHDWTKRFPELAATAGELPLAGAMLDGEVVALQSDGTTSFQALQNVFDTGATAQLVYYVFDLLFLNGHDTRELGLEERKDLLEQAVGAGQQGNIRYSEHVVGNGPEFFAQAGRLHLEGIISKRSGRPYRAGRGLDWLKVKCVRREEFVIGGWTAPAGARSHFGALLLGYYDKRHDFVYAGRVGTGFDEHTLSALSAKLAKLAQSKSPFVNLSGHTGAARGVTWVKPKLVAQIEFSNWTNDGLLRHPSFQGLREDKMASKVTRDRAISPPAANGAPPQGRKKAARPENSEGGAVAGVALSHPDKVLYPDEGITKRDLAEYYAAVADWMLPHVENRLLALVRCPDGMGKACFFQKHPAPGASEHLRHVAVVEKKKTEDYLVLDDLPGLVSLVQWGVLEVHVWGSRADQIEKPDRLIFDLDPDPSVAWPQVVRAAQEVRLLLEDLELTSFVKTTGGKGLHIVVPIRRRPAWDEAKAFCRALADAVVAAAPDRYIATMSKAARKGKIFIDYLRNDRGATAIAPYSTRARSGAPVSMPLAWDELSGRVRSDHFNTRNALDRLQHLKKDPWSLLAGTKQSITAAMTRKLQSLQPAKSSRA